MELDVTSADIAPTLYLEKLGRTTPEGAWSVRQTNAIIPSIGVRVSGAGTWVHLQGTATLNIRKLETSSTYQQLQQEQSISAGIRGFWSWLNEGVNASYFAPLLREMLNELYREKNVEVKVKFDFQVTGTHPNFPREVSPSIQVLNVRFGDGDSFLVLSSEAPCIDSGAVDRRDGTKLPTLNNNTSIISVSKEDPTSE